MTPDEIAANLRRIAEIHADDGGACAVCAVPDGTGYASQEVPWPCQTYRLATGQEIAE